MSTITHLFNVNVEATEHYIISTSPNLIITAESAPGEANSFMASKWGEYNHVKGFETTVDKIKIPLDTIREICTEQGATATALTKGTLPADKFSDAGDTVFWNSAENQLLYMPANIGTGDIHPVCVIILDGTPAPTLVAADIEIV